MNELTIKNHIVRLHKNNKYLMSLIIVSIFTILYSLVTIFTNNLNLLTKIEYILLILMSLTVGFLSYDLYLVRKNIYTMYNRFKESEGDTRRYFYYMLYGYLLIHSHKTLSLLEVTYGGLEDD